MKRIIQIICLTLFTVLGSFSVSHAADFLTPNQGSNNKNVTQSSEVNDNLFVVGDNIKIDAPVKGDVIGLGSKITINAPVQGNIFFIGNTAVINSSISHDTFITAKQLSLTNQGLIKGSLYLSSQTVSNVNQTNVLGKRIIAKRNHNLNQSTRPILGLMSFLTMLIVGLLLLKFFPHSHTNLVTATKKDWGKSLLVGVLSIILIPLISALLFVSIIGIPLAVLLIIFLIIDLYLGLLAVSYLIGYLILKDKLNKYLVFAFGLILFKLIGSVTIIGVIAPILSIFGLGLIINLKLKTYHLVKDKI